MILSQDTTRRPVFLLSLWLLLFIGISAQSQEGTVVIPLQGNKYMSVQACSSQIFRVRISNKKVFSESLLERYGIIKTDWKPVQYTSKKKRGNRVIKTDDFQISINENSGEISVRDLANKIVIEKINYFDGDVPVISDLKKSINDHFEETKSGGGIIGDVNYTGEKKRQSYDDLKGNSVLSVSLKEGERFYGGGSTSRDNIQHRGEVLRMWATYQIAEIPIPFMMSSEGWGILNNTTSLNFFDIGRFDKNKLNVFNTTDNIDFYLMLGNSMDDILDQYTTITGKPYLLPKWMYGLAFGGNMMEDQMDMMNDAVRFRDEKIPCDIFWIEPQWMAKYYDFSTSKTWNQSKFPGEPYWEVEMDNKKREHPHLFIHKLHQLGYKLGLWLCIDHDLSIAEEDNIAQKLGNPVSGQEHWFNHLTKFIDEGVDGFKLDPGRTLDEHPDRKYYNGYSDKEMHNLNQVLLQKQMEETFREHKGIRSFHHYCGGYAGIQHWGASTSGDNGGGKVALFDQLNLGLSGFMNTSADVMEVPANETLQAMHMGFFLPWIQVNSWYGLLHPWYLPSQQKDAFRFYSQLRHNLVPYIYSAALEGSQTGKPILRAMALEFPNDRNTDNLIYQYMFGESFLVGVSSDSIYLPKGNWIDFWTGEKIGGGETIRAKFPKNRGGQLFIKSGAIIPYQKPQQYISTGFQDTILVKVYPEGSTSYSLLEDDGISYKYEKGMIAKTTFNCNVEEDEIAFRIDVANDYYQKELANRMYMLEIFCEQPKEVILNGATIKSEDWSYDLDEGKLSVLIKMNSAKLIQLNIIK